MRLSIQISSNNDIVINTIRRKDAAVSIEITFIKKLLPAAQKIGMLVPAEDQNAQIEAATFRLAAEGRFELEEKYRRWKETHLPAGDTISTTPLDAQLRALGTPRLKQALEDARAGMFAERLLREL